jgi:hypothetical protein
MIEKLSAHDPRYTQALDEFTAEFGIRIQNVLLPKQWKIVMLDGKPEIVITRDGMRALALTAPRPNAVEVVEDLIAHIDDRWPM